MTAVTITRLMSNIRNHVPAALDAAIQLEMFNTLDELFQASNIWQGDHAYTLVPGTTTYVLTPPASGAIVSLLGNRNSNNSRVGASMLTLGTVVLDLTPTTVETLTATCAYTVQDPVDAEGYSVIPAGLLEKYGAGIIAGVVGRMMSQPAKPYTNERMGIYNTRMFKGVVAQARSAVQHKNIHGGQTWIFPRAFARGTQR